MRTTHNGILKNCTVANIAIKAFLRVHNYMKGDLFLAPNYMSYTRRTTH